jgi:hypothetical protein
MAMVEEGEARKNTGFKITWLRARGAAAFCQLKLKVVSETQSILVCLSVCLFSSVCPTDEPRRPVINVRHNHLRTASRLDYIAGH